MSSRNSSMQHRRKEGSKPICMHSNSTVLISSSLVNMLFEASWGKKIAKKSQRHKRKSIVSSFL